MTSSIVLDRSAWQTLISMGDLGDTVIISASADSGTEISSMDDVDSASCLLPQNSTDSAKSGYSTEYIIKAVKMVRQ